MKSCGPRLLKELTVFSEELSGAANMTPALNMSRLIGKVAK